MVRLILVLLFCFNSFSVFSQDMTAVFSPTIQGALSLDIGDIFKGKISIMPHNQDNLERYKSMEGQNFIDYFYVISVDDIKKNSNNYDVLEIMGTFLVRGEISNQPFYIWSHGGENLPVRIERISIKSNKPNAQEDTPNFIVVPQAYDRALKINWAYVALVCLVIIVIIYFVMTYFKKLCLKRKNKNDRVEKINYWNSLFLSCEDRDQYEYIYRFRDQWCGLIGGITPDIQDFFNTLEKYQYKKNWNEYELFEVNSSFEKIKAIMEGINGV